MKYLRSEHLATIGLITLCLLLGVTAYKLPWYSIEIANHAGQLKSLAIAFLAIGLTTLAATIPSQTVRWAALFFIVASATVAVINWFYFGFYRGFIIPQSFLYGLDIFQSFNSTKALGPLWLACLSVLFVLCLSSAIMLHFRTANLLKLKRIIAAVSFLSALVILIVRAHFYPHQDDLPSSNPITEFWSTYRLAPDNQVNAEHIQAIELLKHQAVSDADYPFQTSLSFDEPPSGKNLIIIVAESLRATETGFLGNKPFTPALDNIAQESTVIRDFYANTNQTVRAELAILCSILDYNQGAPLAKYNAPVHNNCLPTLLKNQGYSTHWFHGYTQDFFSRRTFLPAIGFEHIHDQDAILAHKPDAKHLGWGLSDVETLNYAFEQLEQLQEPFFAEILTLTNHHPFDWQWDDAETPLPKTSDDIMGRYRKGIYYTDYAIGQFYQRFKNSAFYNNSILIIVGDHGVWRFDDMSTLPADQAAFLQNEMYSRTPFILHQPGKPAVQYPGPASQVDILPTVLNLLNIPATFASMGRDLMQEHASSYAVMLREGTAALRWNQYACYKNYQVCEDSKDLLCEENLQPLVCGVADSKAAHYGHLVHRQTLMRYQEAAERLTDYANIALEIGFIHPKNKQ